MLKAACPAAVKKKTAAGQVFSYAPNSFVVAVLTLSRPFIL